MATQATDPLVDALMEVEGAMTRGKSLKKAVKDKKKVTGNLSNETWKTIVKEHQEDGLNIAHLSEKYNISQTAIYRCDIRFILNALDPVFHLFVYRIDTYFEANRVLI
jgi:hypothetical protein